MGIITAILRNLPVFSYSFLAAALVISKPTYNQTWKMRSKKVPLKFDVYLGHTQSSMSFGFSYFQSIRSFLILFYSVTRFTPSKLTLSMVY